MRIRILGRGRRGIAENDLNHAGDGSDDCRTASPERNMRELDADMLREQFDRQMG